MLSICDPALGAGSAGSNAGGANDSGSSGSAEDTVLDEVTVEDSRIKEEKPEPKHVTLVDFKLPEPALPDGAKAAVEAAYDEYDLCMQNCRRFAEEGIVDPLSSVAAGFADGRLPGALAGAIGALADAYSGSDDLGSAVGSGADGIGSGLTDARATRASTGRRGAAGVLGSIAGSALADTLSFGGSNDLVSDLIGGAIANYTSGHLRANWNNRGAAGSRLAGIKSLRGGVKGQLVGAGVNALGSAAAEVACDATCSGGGG